MQLKDMIVRYGAMFGKRFNSAQKIRFITTIARDFDAAGYKTAIDKKSVRSNQVFNLYVGDLNRADTIICTYYDTPRKSFGFGQFTPLRKQDRTLQSIAVTLLPFLGLVILGGFYQLYVTGPLWSNGVFNVWDILSGIGLALLIGLLIKYSKGVGNHYNVVRNASSVIACLDLAERLSAKQKTRVAFALTDLGTVNRFGETMLKDRLGDTLAAKQIILLDCVGGDGTIFVGTGRACQALASQFSAEGLEIVDCEADAQARIHDFPKALMITTGYRHAATVIRDKVNSRSDLEMNIENYTTVRTQLLTLL